MRRLIGTVLLNAILVIGLAGTTTAAARAEAPDAVKCLDCLGGACHVVSGSGYHVCLPTALGCECFDDCEP